MDLEVFTFPRNQYFYLSSQTSKGTLNMLQVTFCPQIQQEKSSYGHIICTTLAMQLKFLGFSILNETIKWWIFTRILKFLTWHGFDEFGWNDPKDAIDVGVNKALTSKSKFRYLESYLIFLAKSVSLEWNVTTKGTPLVESFHVLPVFPCFLTIFSGYPQAKNHSFILTKCHGARMTKFSTNPYFIFLRFKC